MAQLIVAGNATPSQVLTGSTFSAGVNYNAAGTMPNNGALSGTTPGIYPAGYYSSVRIPGWTTLASDTTARYGLAAVYDSADGLTIAVDGNNGSYLSTVTAYSHASNAWTTLASDTTARYYLAAVYDSADGLTIAVDGYSTSYIATVTGFIY